MICTSPSCSVIKNLSGLIVLKCINDQHRVFACRSTATCLAGFSVRTRRWIRAKMQSSLQPWVWFDLGTLCRHYHHECDSTWVLSVNTDRRCCVHFPPSCILRQENTELDIVDRLAIACLYLDDQEVRCEMTACVSVYLLGSISHVRLIASSYFCEARYIN